MRLKSKDTKNLLCMHTNYKKVLGEDEYEDEDDDEDDDEDEDEDEDEGWS